MPKRTFSDQELAEAKRLILSTLSEADKHGESFSFSGRGRRLAARRAALRHLLKDGSIVVVYSHWKPTQYATPARIAYWEAEGVRRQASAQSVAVLISTILNIGVECEECKDDGIACSHNRDARKERYDRSVYLDGDIEIGSRRVLIPHDTLITLIQTARSHAVQRFLERADSVEE